MCDVSRATIDDLRALRQHLLLRYTDVDKEDERKDEYRRQFDLISLELVRRTGDTKWKM